MRKIFLHFRLATLCILLFFSLLVVQITYSIVCLYSYKKSVDYLDKFASKHTKIFFYFIRFILGIRFDIPLIKKFKNQYNIDSRKSYIVLCNHQSFADIALLIVAFQSPIRFVAKKVLGRYIPYVSKVNRVYRNALIDRTSGMKTIGVIKDLARRCKRNALPMIIFPEGTRSRTGNVQTFHSVGVRASLLNGPMDIIVAALDGGVFFPKVFSFPYTKNKRYICMKVLEVFENVTRASAEKCVKKAEELIRDQVTRWRKERDVQFPMTEYTGRRTRL